MVISLCKDTRLGNDRDLHFQVGVFHSTLPDLPSRFSYSVTLQVNDIAWKLVLTFGYMNVADTQQVETRHLRN